MNFDPTWIAIGLLILTLGIRALTEIRMMSKKAKALNFIQRTEQAFNDLDEVKSELYKLKDVNPHLKMFYERTFNEYCKLEGLLADMESYDDEGGYIG